MRPDKYLSIFRMPDVIETVAGPRVNIQKGSLEPALDAGSCVIPDSSD